MTWCRSRDSNSDEVTLRWTPESAGAVLWGDGTNLGNGCAYAGNNPASDVGPVKWMVPEAVKK